MSASGRGRKKRGAHGGDHADERWLLTYADMLTLMFALFMVLFSISSVNISKYQTLQKSLKAAFSGSILPGGKSIMRAGSENTSAHSPAQAEVPSIVAVTRSASPPIDSTAAKGSVNDELNHAMAAAAAGNAEQADFNRLKAKLDLYARQHGFGNAVQTVVARNGLTIRVLTDNLLFDSGSAALKSAGLPLLTKVAQLLNVERAHPITVAGHTDDQPIHTAQYETNWQLSTDRATTVVLYLIARGVRPSRLGAAGYADLHPIAPNDTEQGRAENRRVEITLQRLNPFPSP